MPVSSLTITKETLAGPPAPRAALLSGSARTKFSTEGLASGSSLISLCVPFSVMTYYVSMG